MPRRRNPYAKATEGPCEETDPEQPNRSEAPKSAARARSGEERRAETPHTHRAEELNNAKDIEERRTKIEAAPHTNHQTTGRPHQRNDCNVRHHGNASKERARAPKRARRSASLCQTGRLGNKTASSEKTSCDYEMMVVRARKFPTACVRLAKAAGLLDVRHRDNACKKEPGTPERAHAQRWTGMLGSALEDAMVFEKTARRSTPPRPATKNSDALNITRLKFLRHLSVGRETWQLSRSHRKPKNTGKGRSPRKPARGKLLARLHRVSRVRNDRLAVETIQWTRRQPAPAAQGAHAARAVHACAVDDPRQHIGDVCEETKSSHARGVGEPVKQHVRNVDLCLRRRVRMRRGPKTARRRRCARGASSPRPRRKQPKEGTSATRKRKALVAHTRHVRGVTCDWGRGRSVGEGEGIECAKNMSNQALAHTTIPTANPPPHRRPRRDVAYLRQFDKYSPPRPRRERPKKGTSATCMGKARGVCPPRPRRDNERPVEGVCGVRRRADATCPRRRREQRMEGVCDVGRRADLICPRRRREQPMKGVCDVGRRADAMRPRRRREQPMDRVCDVARRADLICPRARREQPMDRVCDVGRHADLIGPRARRGQPMGGVCDVGRRADANCSRTRREQPMGGDCDAGMRADASCPRARPHGQSLRRKKARRPDRPMDRVCDVGRRADLICPRARREQPMGGDCDVGRRADANCSRTRREQPIGGDWDAGRRADASCPRLRREQPMDGVCDVGRRADPICPCTRHEQPMDDVCDVERRADANCSRPRREQPMGGDCDAGRRADASCPRLPREQPMDRVCDVGRRADPICPRPRREQPMDGVYDVGGAQTRTAHACGVGSPWDTPTA
ncbi:hypothetical protein C8J57DRAFT_1591988 [Mycena rebaudengoi]|nr:hypothetical protein C8J57DRAFT_1591988 [Mycena rebaudengoi]